MEGKRVMRCARARPAGADGGGRACDALHGGIPCLRARYALDARGCSLVELALSDNPLGNEVAVNLAAVLSQVRSPAHLSSSCGESPMLRVKRKVNKKPTSFISLSDHSGGKKARFVQEETQ